MKSVMVGVKFKRSRSRLASDLSNYRMHRNGGSRYFHAYSASPSGDADDVRPNFKQHG
jgi:hypothetical protein